MTSVRDVLRALERLAPPARMEDWDNGGLLCGEAAQPVHKILVALDPFLPVCEEAATVGADLLITHHPLIFQPLRSVTDRDEAGAAVLFLARHGISAINAHTNLDVSPDGVNDCLARALGLRDVRIVEPQGTDDAPWGLLRAGGTDPLPLPDFAARVKALLGCPGLRYISGGKPVRRVAVGGGACGSELQSALRAGCDTLVTADVKYNQFRTAAYLGLNLIDAGHFETEFPVCRMLADFLGREFPELPVVLAKSRGAEVQFL